MATANSTSILSTSETPFGLRQSDIRSSSCAETILREDVFDPSSSFHILETELDAPVPKSHEAFIWKMELQYLDSKMDSVDEDWSFVPTSVLAHRVAAVPRKRVHDGKLTVVRDKHVRVKTCWKTGEVSWVSMDSL